MTNREKNQQAEIEFLRKQVIDLTAALGSAVAAAQAVYVGRPVIQQPKPYVQPWEPQSPWGPTICQASAGIEGTSSTVCTESPFGI